MDIKDNEQKQENEILEEKSEKEVEEEISETESQTEEVENTETENLKEPVLSFEYDVKNEEEEEAFLTFQKKYVYKRNWKITIMFSVVAILFIISIFRNPKGYFNYVLAFISLAMIAITWINTRRVRKYLVSALKTLEDDRYRFSLYDDSFKIETIVSEEEKSSEDYVPIKPRIVNFKDISLNVIEKENMFIIILRKETIYVIAKRVIDEEKQEILRNKFIEVLGEDFEKERES